MENLNLNHMKGNCMTGCKHCIVRDLFEKREFRDENGEVYAIMNEHVGYELVQN